ncbi:MAG: hypothetical protein H5T96_09630 [Tissierellales bacterium]|nr:hypothetical protein [Tissierellales bacterium]
MAIGGQQREIKEFNYVLKVGLFEANVVAINPDKEEYEKKKLGRPLEENEELEYLSESEEGNQKLRIDVYVEDVNDKPEEGENKRRYKIAYFLENKERENKDATKKQYINSVGVTAWADSPNNLPEWFVGEAGHERDYRVANSGEEELYTFLTSWLGKLDLRGPDAELELDWKKLMKGNVKELKDQIDGDFNSTFLALATVRVKESPEGIKEYQSVYNKVFFPVYTMRNFRLVDYDNDEQLKKLEEKGKKAKFWEKLVLQLKGEYGCRDLFVLKPLMDYDAESFVAASSEPMAEDDASY